MRATFLNIQEDDLLLMNSYDKIIWAAQASSVYLCVALIMPK